MAEKKADDGKSLPQQAKSQVQQHRQRSPRKKEEGAPESDETTPLVHMRVIYSDKIPSEVRTTHTVASLILGEYSAAERFCFLIGVKNKAATGCLWALWYIGAIIGLMVIDRVLPVSFVWASLLMLPLPCVATFLLSTDLLSELFQSMDLWIVYILQFALFVDATYYCGKDLRIVFWLCYLPTMIVSGLIDAYPDGGKKQYRAFFSKLFFSAALAILLFWNYLLVFRWDVIGGVSKGQTVGFVLHHLSDQLTLGVFYGRHIWNSTFRPDYFAMIKADVLTCKRDVEYHVDSDMEDGKGEGKDSTRSHVFLSTSTEVHLQSASATSASPRPASERRSSYTVQEQMEDAKAAYEKTQSVA